MSLVARGGIDAAHSPSGVVSYLDVEDWIEGNLNAERIECWSFEVKSYSESTNVVAIDVRFKEVPVGQVLVDLVATLPWSRPAGDASSRRSRERGGHLEELADGADEP